MEKRMIKVNLGCGPSGINGWDNYDWGLLPLFNKFPGLVKMAVKYGLLDKWYLEKWPKFKLFDIRRKLPYEDSEVDYIYCSNVLEHFEKFEARKILLECRRVLRKNGVLRIVLPDIQQIIKNYTTADEFCKEFYGYDKDIPKFTNIFIRGHQWMYDKTSFVKLLNEVDFKKIELKSWRKGKVPDINKLDLEIHKKLCFYYEVQ
jgi:predicted SAM-dependent methyltransferase